MRILITGAYGFVGTNLCRFLTEKGHVCDALDIPAAKRDDVPYEKTFAWDDLEGLFSGSTAASPAYDAVVHLAGKAHDTRNVTEPQVYFDVNVGLTKRIFEAVYRKVPRFVYFSSIKALDGDTPYAQSKREAEVFLNGRAIVLEPAMIHGPGNKGNLNLLVKVVKKGIPWPLAAFENQRSFTSIGNICAVVEALCQRGENGTYPMCDDAPVSTNRLIELIAEAYGKPPSLWRLPRVLMRCAAAFGTVLHLPLNLERLGKLTENSVVDNSLLKRALGWSAMPVDAEEGLKATLRSFRDEERKG